MKNISKKTKERVAYLKKTINKYRYLYHVLDKEEISEEALDSLKYELVKLEDEYPELATPDSPTVRIAGKPLAEFRKVRHEVSQWSFNDAFTEEDVFNFKERIERLLKTHFGRDIKPTYTCSTILCPGCRH